MELIDEHLKDNRIAQEGLQAKHMKIIVFMFELRTYFDGQNARYSTNLASIRREI